MNNLYRMSSYTIIVRLDENPDEVFLIHGYTGAIDIIVTSIIVFLEEHETFEKSEIPCSEATQQALEKRGYITQKTAKEEYDYVHRMAEALFKKESLLNYSFTFAVTYDCNFRCPYCFEKGIQKDKTTFTKEMTDKAYQAIIQIAPDERLRSKTISLYGGEPLLKENKEAVSYIVKKGKDLGFKFFAVTNGYDLDYYKDLLSPDEICRIQITIDGIREHHDSRRVHFKGFSTFDKIVGNIGIALQKNVQVVVRVNTDGQNINDLETMQQIFKDLHYADSGLFSMSSSLLTNYSRSEDKSYAYITQTDLLKNYKKLKMEYECQNYGMYKEIKNAIKRGKALSFHSSFCNSQSNGFLFDPHGDIYTCLKVVGQKEHCIGNYVQKDVPVLYKEKEKEWRTNFLFKSESCSKCKYALICGGGCPAQNLIASHCPDWKNVIAYVVNRLYKITIN